MNNRYRADIDGLRAIAVLGVVLYHAGGVGISGGYGGVDVFFVISGFLITGILKGELDQDTYSIARFYERRIRRIFPALFVVVIASLACAYVIFLPQDFKDYAKSVLAVATFSSNYHFLARTGYFDAAATEKPLLHTWSLSVEEQYYFAFPILLALLYRANRKLVVPALAAVAAASFVYNSVSIAEAPARAFFATTGRVWELLVGALLAFVPDAFRLSRSSSSLLGAAGLSAIALGYLTYSDATPFPGGAALLFCLGAAAIIVAGVGGENGFVTRLLSSRILVGIGLISYSVYLWHWPLFVFLNYRYPALFALAGGERMLLGLALAAVSLCLGYLSWRLIETPWRRPARPVRRSIVFAVFASLSLALMVVTIPINRAGGFPWRWPAEVSTMLKPHEMPDDVICAPLYPDGGWPPRACRVGPQNATAETLVWGDSHAEMLKEAFALNSQRSGRSVIVASFEVCPPLYGIVFQGRRPVRGCQDLAAEVWRRIDNGEFRRVVLAGRWAYYAQGTPFGTPGGRPLAISPDGIVANPQVFTRLADETVSRLVARGVEVVILGPVPEQSYAVARASVRELIWGQTVPEDLARSDFEVRQRHVLASFAKLQARKGVRVLYPHERLCDERFCRARREGKPLYWDNNHLNTNGLVPIAPLIDEIFEPALHPH